jgi:general stress protein CsbA
VHIVGVKSAVPIYRPAAATITPFILFVLFAGRTFSKVCMSRMMVLFTILDAMKQDLLHAARIATSHCAATTGKTTGV